MFYVWDINEKLDEGGNKWLLTFLLTVECVLLGCKKPIDRWPRNKKKLLAYKYVGKQKKISIELNIFRIV